MNIQVNHIRALTIVMALTFSAITFNVNAGNEFGIPDSKLISIENKISSMSSAELRVARSLVGRGR